MPVINKYKIINFKYGMGQERILSNRTMELYGENLQVEAENTAGKTMSIQTIIQSICPLSDVAKPFTAIYNKKEPLYSMTEWLLDDGKTLLLTGIGFEKKAGLSKEEGKEKKDDLYKYFMFIIEESKEMEVDIDNIPLLKNNDKGIRIVQSLTASQDYIKMLRDKYGKNKVHFFNNYSRKQHREKLEEYGISQSEWKEIIIKLNSNNKEGGLSDFVKEHNTSEKLIRDKILPLIETSLTTEEVTPILQIKEQVRKCINNIIDIKEKLLDYENYKDLNIRVESLQNKINEILFIEEDKKNVLGELANLYVYIENKCNELKEEIKQYQKMKASKEEEFKVVEYEEDSYEYFRKEKEIQDTQVEFDKAKNELNDKIEELELDEQYLNISKFKRKKKELEEEEKNKIKKESEKQKKEVSKEEITSVINHLGSSIHYCLKEESIINNEKLKENANNNIAIQEKKNQLNDDKSKLTKVLINENSEIKAIEGKERDFNNQLYKFKLNNNDIRNFISNNFLGEVVDYTSYINHLNREIKLIEENLESKVMKIEESNKLKDDINKTINNLKLNNNEFGIKLQVLKTRKKDIDNFKEEYKTIKTRFEIDNELDNSTKLYKEIKQELNKIELQVQDLENNKKQLKKELETLQNYKDIIFEKEILTELEINEIKPIEGMKYLLTLDGDLEYKNNLISKNPLLPYSIIITNKEYQKLKQINLKNKTKISMPIFVRDNIEDTFITISNNLVIGNGVNILSSFDNKALDPEKREKDISLIKEQINSIRDKVEEYNAEIEILEEFKLLTNKIDFTTEDLFIDEKIENYKETIFEINNKIKSNENNEKNLSNKIKEFYENKEELLKNKNILFNKLKDIRNIKDTYSIILENKNKITELKEFIKEIEKEKKVIEKLIEGIDDNILKLALEKDSINRHIDDTESKIKKFKIYEPVELENAKLEELEIKYKKYLEDPTKKEIETLNYEISACLKKIESITIELEEFRQFIAIDNFENIPILFTIEELNKRIVLNKSKVEELKELKDIIKSDIDKNQGSLNTKRDEILKKFNGKEPLSTSLIVNFNFEKRKKDIKKDIKDIDEIIEGNKTTCQNLEQELRDLKKYKVEGKAITYQPEDVFIESKKLQSKLQNIEYNLIKFIKNYENTILEIKEFNYKHMEKYKNFIETLNVNKDNYSRQKEQVEIVLLVIKEEISKLEKHSEQLRKEKTIISRQIKDYVVDCIDEFKIINKLGKHKGQALFNVALPKADKIENSLNLVDMLMDEIVEEANLSDVEQKINTFYILNKILNIGRIPVSVIKYEINRNETIKWNSINNETTGGQRFCISFIVTILLMEYKRYDRNAIIDESKYKGKVLLMDNPFGETSQQDFLKEIFELAKKFKVQIISYTHVTNASVRAMFNKIYLMTVEKTTSNKEFVDINEIKQNKTDESVGMSKFYIGNEEELIQVDIFSLI